MVATARPLSGQPKNGLLRDLLAYLSDVLSSVKSLKAMARDNVADAASGLGGALHNVNGTASIIFELCDGRSDVPAIAAALAATCEAPVDESAVSACIDTLRDRALVT